VFVAHRPRRARLTALLILAACSSCHPEPGTGPTAPPERAPVCTAETLAPSPPPNPAEALAAYVAEHYTKREVQIPMRDGVALFTAIYTPKDASATTPYPILLRRTPYSCTPYGADKFPNSLGPSAPFVRAGYIFVYQDVRGAFMSGGEFEDVRPHRPQKAGPQDIDESSDTFDTIEWLLRETPGNNGKVGLYGISYPGFYAATGMIDAHPALRAVSPQAPIADWFFDDFHHHGAFFLPHTFNFIASFGQARPQPKTTWNQGFVHPTPDGYQFFLEGGTMAELERRHFKGQIAFWNAVMAHPDYDEFWKARDLQPHLKKVAPAVLTVGGWFDAEDLYGPLHVYSAVERQNPGTENLLVMGPWAHGGWSRTDGERLGDIHFGSKTSRHYQDTIELPFFEHHLKGGPPHGLAEASVFETGANRWRGFPSWPPPAAPRSLYFGSGETLRTDAPDEATSFDEYISDPAKPVPFTQDIAVGMPKEYMTEDQRFASRRPDVLVYQTPPLAEDLTVAGPISAELWVSTTGSDADWVVKLIDVLPNDTKDPEGSRRGVKLGGYQMMVRSEAFRGRYRDSYSEPRPFVPGKPTRVVVPLQDVLHTFKKGHRLMIQVQSTWFPLIDRNPQRFVPNIYTAQARDFQRATHRVYRGKTRASKITLPVIATTP
jgi:putative CocE/NonD family hydrolase